MYMYLTRFIGTATQSSVMPLVQSGEYTRMSPKLLPPLWLAYLADPSDSGERKVTIGLLLLL